MLRIGRKRPWHDAPLLAWPGGCAPSPKPFASLLALTLALAWPPPTSAIAGETSGFCFPEPAVRFPDAASAERIGRMHEAIVEASPARYVSLIEAIITHESDGIAHSVSPTGCAGLGAICLTEGEPCCKNDPTEHGWYQKCDEEAEKGYHCDWRTDPRFESGHTIKFINWYFGLTTDHTTATDPLLLAMAYNAGPSFLKRLLATAGGDHRVDVLLRHLFLGNLGYRRRSTEERIQKMIEVYDYVAWIESHLVFWEAKRVRSLRNFVAWAYQWLRQPRREAQICFRLKDDTWEIDRVRSIGPDELCAEPVEIVVYRLEFGEYRKGSATACLRPASEQH